jgi:hypothetical protein
MVATCRNAMHGTNGRWVLPKTGEGCFVIRLLLMVNHFDGRNTPSNTPKRPVHGDSAVCKGIVQVALAAGFKHTVCKKLLQTISSSSVSLSV